MSRWLTSLYRAHVERQLWPASKVLVQTECWECGAMTDGHICRSCAAKGQLPDPPVVPVRQVQPDTSGMYDLADFYPEKQLPNTVDTYGLKNYTLLEKPRPKAGDKTVSIEVKCALCLIRLTIAHTEMGWQLWHEHNNCGYAEHIFLLRNK